MITANMANPGEWSDWNGQSGTTVTAAFETAISHVQQIGLSFGGDCFFETGVRADYPARRRRPSSSRAPSARTKGGRRFRPHPPSVGE
jgi:hypothetical protein